MVFKMRQEHVEFLIMVSKTITNLQVTINQLQKCGISIPAPRAPVSHSSGLHHLSKAVENLIGIFQQLDEILLSLKSLISHSSPIQA